MAGGFFGGVLKGAESVQGMFLRQQEADARQKLADQSEWEFNQKKGLSDAMGGISAEQTQAEQDNSTARQNTDDAILANASGVAGNDPAAVDADGTPVTQTQALTEPQKTAVAKAYGVKAPVSIQYQFNQKRIAALQKAGDLAGAQKLRTESNANLAGAAMGAYDIGDERTVADLYNLFPNGRSVAALHIAKGDADGHPAAKAGDLIIQDAGTDGRNGTPRVISQFQFIQGIASQMNPEERFKLMNSEMAIKARALDHAAAIAAANERARLASDTRLSNTAMNIGAKGAGRGSGPGSEGGTGAAHDAMMALVKLDGENKDAGLFTKVGPDGKGSVHVAPSAVLNSAKTLLDSVLRANPGISQNDAVRYAYGAARTDAGLTTDFKKNVTLDPLTGAANVDIGQQGIGPDGKSPMWIKQANLYKHIDMSQIMNYNVTPDSLKAAQVSWVKGRYGNDPDAMQAYAQVATGDNSLRASLIQAHVLKGYAPAVAAQIVDNSARHVAAAQAARVPEKPVVPPTFTAEQLADAKSRGITPPATLADVGRNIVDKARKVRDFAAGGIRAIRAPIFSSALEGWRSGNRTAGTATTIYDMAKANPAFMAQLSPEERTDIQVQSGQSF